MDGERGDAGELWQRLVNGAGEAADLRARQLLGQSDEQGDAELACALVRVLATDSLDALTRSGGPGTSTEGEEAPAPAPVVPEDASFLGQLEVSAAGVEESRLPDVEDAATLLAVVRGGDLVQRRAALHEIHSRLSDGKFESAEDLRLVQAELPRIRDVEVAYELRQCRALLSGPVAREARGSHQQVLDLAIRIESEAQHYWDGVEAPEPFMALSGDWRAQLMSQSRDLSPQLIAHVAALIEGVDTSSQRGNPRAVLSALRYAADPRLVPSLVSVLQAGSSELEIEAARALSHIEDPRVFPRLVEAYDRSVLDVERLGLAEALGRVGDRRAVDYVRAQLEADDELLLGRCLEALRTVGSVEDTEAVCSLLRHPDPVIVLRAARTLGSIGDGRAAPALRSLIRSSASGAVRAAVEEALIAMAARMELRGEQLPDEIEGPLDLPMTQESVRPHALQRAPFSKVIASRWSFVLGRCAQMLGLRSRALGHFDQASVYLPGWVTPLIVMGMIHGKRDDYPLALSMYRRALDVDRARVEANPIVIRSVARCYLRRSEEVEAEGRVAVACGLLEEVLSLDLRRSPSSLRIEITRRHEALRAMRKR